MNCSRLRAFTLIEILVVIAIIAILAAILFPVFGRARENARRASCQSNLKQMGIAIAMYREDFDGVNPRHRSCPDLPDITTTAWDESACYSVIPATTVTGPNEIWWAPFANSTVAADLELSPEAQVTRANYREGFLQPYVKSVQIFRCPSEPKWQVGYAMSYIDEGPMGKRDSQIVNPSALFVWDHARTPGCADTRTPKTAGTAWGIFPPGADAIAAAPHTHYPVRHLEGFNALRYDGGVKFRRPTSLVDADFTATS